MSNAEFRKNLLWRAGLAVAFFFLGMIYQKYQPTVGAVLGGNNDKQINQIRQSDFSAKDYKFIDPLLACNISNDKAIEELKPLKEKINSLINSRSLEGKIDAASVYFDNREGSWLSLNPQEQYSPASLIKVPVGMAFLKIAQRDPNILKKQIVYNHATDENDQEYYKPANKLTYGKSYSVEELTASLLGSSDNNALYLLLNNIEVTLLDEVTTDLGVVIPRELGDEALDFLTIKQYVNFFRVLHNASYLNRTMSEKALSWMSQTEFKQGLNRGLPPEMVVAHKFGERDLGKQKELHDCGIVYYPNQPYLLCVMTKGGDFKALSETIGDISKLVYNFIKEAN